MPLQGSSLASLVYARPRAEAGPHTCNALRCARDDNAIELPRLVSPVINFGTPKLEALANVPWSAKRLG